MKNCVADVKGNTGVSFSQAFLCASKHDFG